MTAWAGGSTGRCFTTATMRATQAPIWVTTSRPPSTFPDEVCVVADRKSFSLLVECIKGNGYHFTAHPDWNVPLRPSFQEALDFFQRKV